MKKMKKTNGFLRNNKRRKEMIAGIPDASINFETQSLTFCFKFILIRSIVFLFALFSLSKGI